MADSPDTMNAEPATNLETARGIVRRAHAISPSPSLLRLEAQLRQGDTTARQLARLIEGSPALAARVLRMANSAFYAPAEPVASLSRAVALLGDTVLRQLVLTSLIVSRRAGGRSPRQNLAAARLTGDAVRAAVVARTLADLTRLADSDQAFASGLLHDLGHVYLLDEVGEPYADHLLQPNDGFDEAHELEALERELELSGTNHQEVGAVFAYEWNLPPQIARVLWDHHGVNPGALNKIVRATDKLVRALTRPVAVDGEPPAAVDEALAEIGLESERWASRVPTVRDQFAELLTIFDVAA